MWRVNEHAFENGVWFGRPKIEEIMTLICAWRWGAWSQDRSLLFMDISLFLTFFYKEKKRTNLLELSLPNVRHMWQPQFPFPLAHRTAFSNMRESRSPPPSFVDWRLNWSNLFSSILIASIPSLGFCYLTWNTQKPTHEPNVRMFGTFSEPMWTR